MSKYQVIVRKCCKGALAACCYPEYEDDADWVKEIANYRKTGHEIKLVDEFSFMHEDGCKFSKAEIAKIEQLTKDPNQLNLFS